MHPLNKKCYDKEQTRLTLSIVIGKNALMEQLIILQNNVITLLRKKDTLDHVVHPRHDYLVQQSESVVRNTISALKDQYQRIDQARPIRPAPSSSQTGGTSGNNCGGTIEYVGRTGSSSYACQLCHWVLPDCLYEIYSHTLTKDGRMMGFLSFIKKFHYQPRQSGLSGGKSQWKCCVCHYRPIFATLLDFGEHIRFYHTIGELENWKIYGSLAITIFDIYILWTWSDQPPC